MKKMGRFCIATMCAAMPLTAMSGEIGDIQWHGFLTGAYMAASGAGEGVHYSGDVSDKGTTKDTRLGLTVNTQVDEKWRFAAQMKAKGVNDYSMEMDWAYATYDYSDAFSVNVGEIKYPVGLYNEYIEVGYTYPWIRAPETFYNQNRFGPNLTRISYSGLGLVFSSVGDESETDLNIFGGLVDVADGHVNQLLGAKFGFNWADMLRFQLAATTGIMEIEKQFDGSTNPRFAMMNGERHTSYTAGIGLDMESFVFSSEVSSATMGDEMMATESGYAMLGYRFGDFMPHVTYGRWNVKGGWGQTDITVGLRTELTTNTALKFEAKQVTPGDKSNPDYSDPADITSGGYGLFNAKPENEKTIIYGVALELVF